MDRNLPYEKIKKYCETCERRTSHVIESMVTVCMSCNTAIDDDGDELFGPVDEVVE